MQISEIMSTNPVTVHEAETVSAAARLLSRHGVGALPVVDDRGRLRGILTDRDVTVRCVAAGRDPAATAVRAVMSPRALTAESSLSPLAAARLMAGAGVRRLPVTEGGRLVGMFSQRDLAAALEHESETAEAYRAVFSSVRPAAGPPEPVQPKKK